MPQAARSSPGRIGPRSPPSRTRFARCAQRAQQHLHAPFPTRSPPRAASAQPHRLFCAPLPAPPLPHVPASPAPPPSLPPALLSAPPAPPVPY
eukprot:5214605-Prymnesium_polylepis.1